MRSRHGQAAFEQLCGKIEVVITGEDPDKYSSLDFMLIGRTYLGVLPEKSVPAPVEIQQQTTAEMVSRAITDSFPRGNGVRLG